MLMHAQPSTNGRHHEEAPLRGLANFLLRNRLLIGGLTLAVLLATFVFLQFTRPVYESAASLRVDQERSNVAVLDALSSLSTGSEIDTEMEELRSRTLAEAVVDSLHLQLSLESPKRVPRDEVLRDLDVSRDARKLEIRLERTEQGAFALSTSDDAPTRTVRIGEPIELPGVRFTLAEAAVQHESIRLKLERFGETVRNFAERMTVDR